MSSGGGYGDPLDREPERVVTDVENGLVSRQEAREIYGVVVARDGTRCGGDSRAALQLEPRTIGGKSMSHPLRANLVVDNLDGAAWICCAPCGHKYCRAGEDWRELRQNPPAGADQGRRADVCLQRPIPAAPALLPVLRSIVRYRFRRGECRWLRKGLTGRSRSR